VAGKDRHSDGSTGSTLASNVVHLRPRQWLDTEEDLVPIGWGPAESGSDGPASRPDLAPPPGRNGTARAAGAPSLPDAPGHASTWLGAGEETVPIARDPAQTPGGSSSSGTESWAAADFWGEDAASVHDALEAPVQDALEAPVQDALEAPVHDALEASVPAPPAGEPHGQSPPRAEGPCRSVKIPALAAVAIAAAALIAAALNGFASAPAAPRSSETSASLHASTTVPSTANVRSTADAAAAGTTADAVAAATTAARLRTTAANERRIRESAELRSHSRTLASRAAARRDQRRSAPTTTAAAAHYIKPAPTSTPYRSTAPTQDTSTSSPSRAGPTGTTSLIGAGTSSSG
jgi:hypothetical protein